ncbi:hypothetical protein DS901_06910 [Loktanella sp. D2R18]|nr:hypothetical protein DS901_06910 [Loktanella sp. D2R18]
MVGPLRTLTKTCVSAVQLLWSRHSVDVATICQSSMAGKRRAQTSANFISTATSALLQTILVAFPFGGAPD